eukprot:gene16055-21804_t
MSLNENQNNVNTNKLRIPLLLRKTKQINRLNKNSGEDNPSNTPIITDTNSIPSKTTLSSEEEAMILAKRQQWIRLKAAGVLDKIDPNAVDMEEIDTMASKVTVVEPSSNDNDVNNKTSTISSKVLYDIQVRLTSSNDNPLLIFNILNEMKDKKIYDNIIIPDILMMLSRLENSSSYTLRALKLFLSLLSSNTIIIDSPARYLTLFSINCYASNQTDVATYTMNHLIDTKQAQNHQFIPGFISLLLLKMNSQYLLNNKIETKDYKNYENELNNHLYTFHQFIKQYPISDVNMVIRLLGRARPRRSKEIFELFTIMRKNYIKPNSESLEFLANSLVLGVESGVKANSMKTLPKPSKNVPE